MLDHGAVVLGVEREPVGQRRQPDSMPTPTSTIGADTAHRCEELGQHDGEEEAAAGHDVDEVGGHPGNVPVGALPTPGRTDPRSD